MKSLKFMKKRYKIKILRSIIAIFIVIFIIILTSTKIIISGDIHFSNGNLSLTIICLPYPVKDNHTRNRYFITMSSWLLTSPSTNIMILMPPYEFDPNGLLVPILEDLFGKGRIIYGPSLETDEDGVPYIDEWFIKGLDASSTEIVCWINADIITPKGWFPRIKYLYDYFHSRNKQFAVISRRCDFDYPENIAQNVFLNISKYLENPQENQDIWPLDYDEIAKFRRLHSPWGIDFFLISKEPMQINFDDIPAFHLGRYRWDPWICGWLKSHMPLITLGDDFCTYHLNHVPKNRQMQDIKVKENHEIGRRNKNYNIPNGLSSYYLKGRYFYQRDVKIPLSKIYDSIPLANAPIEEEKK